MSSECEQAEPMQQIRWGSDLVDLSFSICFILSVGTQETSASLEILDFHCKQLPEEMVLLYLGRKPLAHDMIHPPPLSPTSRITVTPTLLLSGFLLLNINNYLEDRNPDYLYVLRNVLHNIKRNLSLSPFLEIKKTLMG